MRLAIAFRRRVPSPIRGATIVGLQSNDSVPFVSLGVIRLVRDPEPRRKGIYPVRDMAFAPGMIRTEPSPSLAAPRAPVLAAGSGQYGRSIGPSRTPRFGIAPGL